jgi:fatty-acyl-CoA synthase
MQQQLLISTLITHAERHHGDTEIVSRRVEGGVHRYTYRDCHTRTRQMANALSGLGVKHSDRVATLAWNGYRHMELYYAISGSGAVMHTMNPRLHADQLRYIVNHAQDQYFFFDITFLPLVKEIAPECKHIRAFVAMTDRLNMPQDSGVANLLCYEDLIDASSPKFVWPTFDENAASSVCYTSGTTGNPKGVLYSHRSTLLHTFAAALPDGLNCAAGDVIMPIVPMFHVNGWGLPYIACMVGAKLVFPGPGLDPKSVFELIESEAVTMAAGVPTIWQSLLAYLEPDKLEFSTLLRAVIGGAACSTALLYKLQDAFGVHVIHAWGMTEVSPIGTVSTLKAKHANLAKDRRYAIQCKQGRAVYGVDMKIVNDQGDELAWNDRSTGDLLVRGPWIISDYFGSEQDAPLALDAAGNGWFPTGDVAKIDSDGYMQITDRSKDVIKSGGEWIGSIDLENIAMAHPDVAMAACIAAKHAKWDERPLLVVVKKPGAALTKEALLAFYEGKIAKWWTPDDVVFVPSIALGGTGKMLKNVLRQEFENHLLKDA